MKIDPQTLFSALANDIRLRCLSLLQLEGELCVCELIHALELSQPMISRHLATLRGNGLVSDRREGQWVYYSLNAKQEDWVNEILQLTVDANYRREPFRTDLKRLRSMPDRPASSCCA